MKTIWKYPLQVREYQTLGLPSGAEVLTAQQQDGKIQLWALIDTDGSALQERHFIVAGTGGPLPGDPHHLRKYLATVQIEDFVWHVFELVGR